MKHLITPEFLALFEGYSLYSQESSKDPMVRVKLFDTFGSATWFLTEYNQESKIAFGYVTGLIEDEWGYVSLEELEAIKDKSFGIPRIERDLYFEPKAFSKVIAET